MNRGRTGMREKSTEEIATEEIVTDEIAFT